MASLEITFDKKVDLVLESIGTMLKEKNKKYGNSALNPIRVFSKADPIEQLKVRMDDKLSRIFAGTNDNEDTIADLMGYLVIYKIACKDFLIKLGVGNGESNRIDIKTVVGGAVDTVRRVVDNTFKG